MIALISFLLVILMSVVVVKIGSIALQTTGLSKDVADFQAQSAFSGVGFTTSESESIVTNPVRRKILRFLMLLGSAGLTTAVATLVLTLTSETQTRTIFGYTFLDNALFDIVLIAIALMVFYFISSTKIFDQCIRWLFRIPLQRLKKKVFLYDYEQLLGLSKGFSIATFEVPSHNWMVNKSIGQLRMQKEAVLVLGISRKVNEQTEFVGSPSLQFTIKAGDKITLYGQQDTLVDIAKRPKGTKGTHNRQIALKRAEILKGIKKLDEKRLEEISHMMGR